MANVLPKDKQIAIIAALAEGSSLRAVTRITGIHRTTIMNLGLRVGQGCARLLDEKMRDLTCHYLQFDEIWGFIGKKEKHRMPTEDPTLGDVCTFCALDSETKLVPAFKVGKRNHFTANAFVSDVASRIKNRPQISTDGLRAYVEAVENAFGSDVDYGMIIKNYGNDTGHHHQERRYSAPEIVFSEKQHVVGHPDMDMVSTSHIERLNGTTRLHMKRLARLTYAFSKKLESFEAAVALHFAYYNLVRSHGSLKMTPAMAAGVEKSFWTVGDLIEASL
jgi:IS1 family transposase